MVVDDDLRPNSYLMAEVLAGSWRKYRDPELPSADAIPLITSLSLKSGTAALMWWRFQSLAEQAGNHLSPFQQAFSFYTLRAGVHEAQARDAFALLRAGGVEPVLVKGWSVSRRYPAKGLRPYGDIDLCVNPSDYYNAMELAVTAEGQRLNLDLHKGIEHLDSRPFEEFFDRTHLVPLGDTMIRIPSEEDILRIACLHMLRHGGWRPLQLCDVALLLETRSPEFHWDICLGRSRREINWISTAVGLAHHLIGADIEGYPHAAQARRIPRWLIAQVLKSWRTPEPTKNAPLNYGRPIRSYLRRPQGFVGALRRRWPNPIEATYSLNGLYNRLPRFPYQLADGLRRAARLLI